MHRVGDSCVACSAEAAAVGAVHEAGDEAGVIGLNLGEEDKGTGGDDEGGDRTNCGGNRWPRQETLALLQIRSDMDAVFRDSSLKGPLWEEVAR
ncbi:Trihelix transcription factor GT-2 [Morella rubra]|uniref:Trihelix transcription factor GT-2 n=1 Tax=Morella rubra TaxID=262757 RepID=A0A6A1WAX5_9ROSI|nr:Trihelix transcription factor GT-2 [Morella rubra]